MKKPNLLVVKIGGNVIDNEKSLNNFLQQFSNINGKKILVHGGGKIATSIAEKLKIKQKFINGRRITDKETLKIAIMVYAGLVNKTIVAKLQYLGCNSIGISGADGNFIISRKRNNKNGNFGYVGDVQKCDSKIIINLFKIFDSIILSPITVDKNGQLLNTNSDSILKEVAIVCKKIYKVNSLICFEKNGVYEDISNPASLIKIITLKKYKYLLNEKKISDGMLPKLENCFELIKSGLNNVRIGNSNKLTKLLDGKSGTLITNE